MTLVIGSNRRRKDRSDRTKESVVLNLVVSFLKNKNKKGRGEKGGRRVYGMALLIVESLMWNRDVCLIYAVR